MFRRNDPACRGTRGKHWPLKLRLRSHQHPVGPLGQQHRCGAQRNLQRFSSASVVFYVTEAGTYSACFAAEGEDWAASGAFAFVLAAAPDMCHLLVQDEDSYLNDGYVLWYVYVLESSSVASVNSTLAKPSRVSTASLFSREQPSCTRDQPTINPISIPKPAECMENCETCRENGGARCRCSGRYTSTTCAKCASDECEALGDCICSVESDETTEARTPARSKLPF